MSKVFTTFSRTVERATGSPWAFLLALLSVLVWCAFGPLFDWSEWYQMIINTGTTIITFLMVFAVQSNQTRSADAVHIKLDELLRAIEGARTSLVVAEDLDRAELDKLRDELHEEARRE